MSFSFIHFLDGVKVEKSLHSSAVYFYQMSDLIIELEHDVSRQRLGDWILIRATVFSEGLKSDF